MRGTYRQTNKALSEPILVMGAERSLVIMSCLFWGWALMGIFPHWPFMLMIIGWVANLYFLRFVAKRDPQGVAVFRKNSRFLLQNRFYVSRGYAGHLIKLKKLNTVPTRLLARM